MKTLTAIALCLLSARAFAQMPMEHFDVIPDFRAAYPAERQYIVPEGETMAFPTGDYDLVWIEGTCIAPTDADDALRVREIVVAPTGTLIIGQTSDPVMSKINVTWADGQFLPDDPGQWGFGLLVFGKIRCVGKPKTSWTESDVELTGSSVPIGEGWESGDRVLLPDTSRPNRHRLRSYRESLDYFLTDDLSLDMPLAFVREKHEGIGPIVANMSKSITFESENPDGMRGHCIVTDHADPVFEGVAFTAMGRTKPEPLSNKNIVGRYAFHTHHLHGPDEPHDETFVLKDCVFDGVNYAAKWGLVVHQTSWGRVENCVVTRFGGAGVICEQGGEVGNVFRRNLSFDNDSGSQRFPVAVDEGFEGVGFWFASMANYLEDNVAINNRHGFQSAITTIGSGIPGNATPWTAPSEPFHTSPGGTIGNLSVFHSTLSAKGNRFCFNVKNGYDSWGSEDMYIDSESPLAVKSQIVPHGLPLLWTDCLFAHNGSSGAGNRNSDNSNLFENCVFRDNNIGVGVSIDYRRHIYCDGCLFDDLETGSITGRSSIFRGNVFDCDIAIQGDSTTSQSWPFGLTIDESNIFTGERLHLFHRGVQIDESHELWPDPCLQNLDDIYSNIAAFRESIIGTEEPEDPNAAERQRLIAAIAEAEAQIVVIEERIAELTAQLEDLDEI